MLDRPRRLSSTTRVQLVVGATGLLGSEICRQLAEREMPFRALVRSTSDPETAARLRELGAELIEGDLKQPSTLQRACEGVHAVISTATAISRQGRGDSIESVDRDGQLALVDAAEAAGVGRLVYVSMPEYETQFPLQTAKRAVERALRESALEYCILRPANFQDVWLTPALGFDPHNGQVQVFGSGETPVSWISVRDVARVCVDAAGSDVARNAVIDLGGPEALTYRDVIRIFEEETGRECAATFVPEQALEAQKASAADSLTESFAGAMLATAREAHAVDMGAVLRDFPIELTSVRDYARATATQA